MAGKKGIKHKMNGLFYLIAGGAIGAGLGLLFAPKSGKEMRENISKTAKKGVNQAKEFSSNLSEKAKTIYDKAQTAALDNYETAKNRVNEAIGTAKGNFYSKKDRVPDELESINKQVQNSA